MKKLLALVLALVMSLSLVTISNAAFKDADKISHDEAVTVMNAVGVLVGDNNGNFNAKDNLTRAQAAKIVSYLLLGNKTAEALVGSNKFTDVAASNWAAGFIGYCASTNVVAGVGNGQFAPDGQLTGYQFAKMLLVALGYDAKIEGFVGNDWQINVSKRADQADLFDGLEINGNAALTREQAAQMALNTLKSPLIEYDNKGGNISVNGAEVSIGASNAEYKTTSTKLSEQTIFANQLNSSAGKYIVEFAEQYYPKLVLKSNESDDFGRPSHTWLLDNKKLGSYVEDADYEYTTAITGKALYETLGKNTVENYKFSVYVDGVAKNGVAKQIAKDNKADLENTGNGALTQVFVNSDDKTVVITVINTYLAKAAGNYNSKNDSVSLKIYTTGDGVTKKVDGDELAISEIKEDDFLLVTYCKASGVDKVKSIAKPGTIEDSAIESFKSGKDGNVTVGGTKYEYNEMAKYDAEVLADYTTSGGVTNLKDITYNLYLDQYGYVIGVEEVEAAKNYVFITGIDFEYSSLATKNVTANAIFTDGTTKVISVKNDDTVKNLSLGTEVAKATVNKWFTYTMSTSDVYTLGAISDTMQSNKSASGYTKVAQGTVIAAPSSTSRTEINKKYISMRTNPGSSFNYAYGNDATIYLSANVDKVRLSAGGNVVVVKDVESVTTGVKNVDMSTMTRAEMVAEAKAATGEADQLQGAYFLYKDNGYIVAAVVLGEDEGTSKKLVYVTSSKVASESYDKATGKWTWTREVAQNGEFVTLTETNDSGVSELKNMDNHRYEWFEVKFNAQGNVVSAEQAKNAKSSWTKTGYVNEAKDIVPEIQKSAIDTVLYEGQTLTTPPSLKGSTLYFDGMVDTGIVVANDVKYVYTQMLNNKWTTTCENGFGALKTALDELNKSVSYKCGAVIENGIATVVTVYDNTKGTYTQSGTTTGGSGTYYKNLNVAKYTNGMAVVSFDAVRPDFVTEGVALNFSYDILVNGQLYATNNDPSNVIPASAPSVNSKTVTVSWNNFTAPYQYLFLMNGVKDSDNITVEVKWTNLGAQNYVIKYYDEKGAELTVAPTANAPLSSATASANNTDTELDLDFASTYTAGLTYTVKSAMLGKANALVAAGNVYTTVDGADTNAGTKAKVKVVAQADSTFAEDYIKVVIDTANLTMKPITYSIGHAKDVAGGGETSALNALKETGKTTTWAGQGSAITVKVTADKVASIAPGSNVSVKVEGQAYTINKNADPLKVTLDIGGTEFVMVYKNTGASFTPDAITKLITVNSDIDVTVKSVVTLATPKISSITFNDVDGNGFLSNGALVGDDTITIHFSEKIKAGTAMTAPTVASGSTLTLDTGLLAADGMSATFKVTASAADVTALSKLTFFASNALEADSGNFNKADLVWEITGLTPVEK